MRSIPRLACAIGAAVATSAAAQTYPAKPITLVNAFPPGGPTDVVARQIAAKLSQRLGQHVIVDNKKPHAGAAAGRAAGGRRLGGHRRQSVVQHPA